MKFASKELRNDRKLVLIAVYINGLALEYASELLRNNIDIVMLAILNNGKVLGYAGV